MSVELRKLGHNVVVYCVSSEVPHDEVIEQDGITVIRRKQYIKLRWLSPLSLIFGGESKVGLAIRMFQKMLGNVMAFKVAREVRELKCDIVHQHDFVSSIVASKMLARAHPVILTNHTGEYLILNGKKTFHPLLRYFIKHYNAILGPSKELCELPPGSRVAPIEYIPNGVDTKKFCALPAGERELLRERLGFKAEEVVVFCPRRWAPTKGVKYLALAVKESTETSSRPLRFIFGGSDYDGFPAYRAEVLSILSETGSRNVDLLGDIPYDVISLYYQAADIVVIPSILEATSLSALEAMASGVPVIASDVGGIPELITANITGLLVAPKSPSAIAGAIKWLVEHPMEAQEIGKRAREYVLLHYSWYNVALRVQQTYRECISQCT
ncbi:MAG: glycosyltransferase family 4 protein [Alicyclobacillus sp.]|nr:glycosyltransferase family 4 protein [Alicyclobacillus sp.]